MKIESAIENDFVKTRFLDKPFTRAWIGLSKQEVDGRWKWSDGSFLTGYQNWADNEPNNYGGVENCTESEYNGRWNDNKCSSLLPFICEK